jgi:hypothetical protein
MTKNPTSLTILTPDDTECVENVETWWRDNGDLIVQYISGDEDRFPLGEIISSR